MQSGDRKRPLEHGETELDTYLRKRAKTQLETAAGCAMITSVNLRLVELQRQRRQLLAPESTPPSSFELCLVKRMTDDGREIRKASYTLYIEKIQGTSRQTDCDATSSSREIICQDNLIVTPDASLTSHVYTHMAPEHMDTHFYHRKGFATLLVHVLVYLSACARINMPVSATHPTTARQYRLYRSYADMSDGVRNANRQALYQEHPHADGTDHALSMLLWIEHMSDETRRGLMSAAADNITATLDAMARDNARVFAARNPFVVPL